MAIMEPSLGPEIRRTCFIDLASELTPECKGTSVDVHPIEPWIMASFTSGMVGIWNYRTNERLVLEQVSDYPVMSSKFVPLIELIVAAEGRNLQVCDYKMTKCETIEAHNTTIRCVAVHPTLPYVLSSADDIRYWNSSDWECLRVFNSQIGPILQVKFNPEEEDPDTFASVSLNHIKISQIEPFGTLAKGPTDGVTCVDYVTGGDETFLITGSRDGTVKVWDSETMECFQNLRGHTGNVSAVCFHPKLPIIITGSEDGAVNLWNSTTYKLERSLDITNRKQVWAIGCMEGSRRVVIVHKNGIVMVKIGREAPAASMDNSGKVAWAKHNKIQTADLSVESDHEVSDGESLSLEVKELGTCDFYTQSLKCNPDGQFAVCGSGKYIIFKDLAWENRLSRSALEIVWSPGGEYAARESTSRIKIYSKDFQEKISIQPSFSAERIYGGTLLAVCSKEFICFYDWAEGRLIQRINVIVKNVYWAERSDQVAIVSSSTSFYMLKFKGGVLSSHLDSIRTSDEGVTDAFKLLYKIDERVRTGIWIKTEILAEDFFIYIDSARRLNYCVGGKVTTMFHLDRPMYLLGYLANRSRVYLIDRDFNVTKYRLPLRLVEYKTLVMRGDLKQADTQILPLIPNEQRDSVARFLELQGMIDAASKVAIDPDYKFELATQLGNIIMAKDNKHIVWVIVVEGIIKGNDAERHASGVTVKGDVPLGKGHELIILSCAQIFVQFSSIVKIMVRRLDKKDFELADMIYKNRRLNLAALSVTSLSSSTDDYGVLARDGSIFPGECLFYHGNPVNFVGSSLVGEACYPCKNDVFKVMDCECSDYVSSVWDKACDIRLMGHLYDRRYLNDLKYRVKEDEDDQKDKDVQKDFDANGEIYESGLDASVPIIQISGFLDRDGVLGGPVFNSRGEIVGVLVSKFEANFQIAVHVRAIDTFFRFLGA